MDRLEVGKVYTVNHARKGKFTGRVIHDNGDSYTLEIIVGEAKMKSAEGNRTAGDEVHCRHSLIASAVEVPTGASISLSGAARG